MRQPLNYFSSLINSGIDADSEIGHKIRHFRICFFITSLCYVFWTLTIVLLDLLGASFFGDKLLVICFLNTSLFALLFFASFKLKYVRKNIEWIALISLLCVICHSVLAIRYNPQVSGYWIASTMTYVASIIMLVSRRAIFLFSICVSIAYALSTLTLDNSEYSMLIFFEIAVAILGFISWTVVPKEVWAFKALAKKDERIAKLFMQKLFLKQIGHDLKTPLVSLIALLPRAKEKIRNEDAEWREMFDVMIESSQLMHSLVESVTMFNNLSSGRFPPKKELLSLSRLVKCSESMTLQVAKGRPPKFINEIDSSISLMADEVMMQQILNNLFSNSVKYASPARDLEIQIQASVEGNLVSIRIADNGIGMTGEQADRAFDVFYRVDTSRTDITSSGIGLAICKEIAHLHGGEIFVEKSSPEGTSIMLTLPLKNSGGGVNGDECIISG